MALTPLEIRKKAFTRSFRGYTVKEVRAFLAIVASEFEELRKERAALAEKVDELASRVATFEKMEKLLKDTLLTAQQVAEEMRANVERERQLMVERIKQESEKMRSELNELKGRRALLLDEIRGIANTYLALVARFEKGEYEHREADTEHTAETKDSGKRSSDKK